MADSKKSFSTTDSDAESHSSDTLDSWIELLAAEKLASVSFLNVPSSFSRHRAISVKFKYIDFVASNSDDFVGIYSILSNDAKKPLCKKVISLDGDRSIGSVSFSPNEIPKYIDDGEYCFMYVQRENIVFGISTAFVIENDTKHENDEAINIDSSEEEFIVISSQQLKTENDELRNLLKQLEEKLKQKEEQINTLTHCASELKDQVREDQATITNLNTKLDDTVMLHDALVKKNNTLLCKMAGYDKDRILFEKEMEDNMNDARLHIVKSESKLQALVATKDLIMDEMVKQKNRYEAEIAGLKFKNDVYTFKLEASMQDAAKAIEKLNAKVKQYEKNLEETFNEVSAKVKNVMLYKKNEDLHYLIRRSVYIISERSDDLECQLADSKQKIMDLEKEKTYLSHQLKNMQDEIICKNASASQSQENSEAIIQDLKKRLTDAAEIYKRQYLTIRGLKKQVANFQMKTGELKEQIPPFVTGDAVFTKLDMDKLEKHSGEAKGEILEEKLPEKCVIHFSGNRKEVLVEDDDETLECDNLEKSRELNIKGKQTPKNATVPISDSDTGEYVSKRGPSCDSKLADYKYAEAEVPFWNDAKKNMDGYSAESNEQNGVMKDGNNTCGSSDLESNKWKFTPCFKNFLLDDPANMPNLPLRPSAPFLQFCDEKDLDRMTSALEASHINPFDAMLLHTKDSFNSSSSFLPRSSFEAANSTSEKWNKEMTPFDNKNTRAANCSDPCPSRRTVPYSDAELQSAYCPFCGEIFYTILTDSSVSSTSSGFVCSSLEQLWDHLEVKHHKLVCPVCGALFDCQHGHGEFECHVNTHL